MELPLNVLEELIRNELKDKLSKAKVVGLGTTRTTTSIINILHRMDLLRNKILVTSSIDTSLKLLDLGYRVSSYFCIDFIDIYIDSADEVDYEGNMIKGGGAALTLEKVLTYFSKYRVFIVTSEKVSKKICTKKYIPIEVLPEALTFITKYLKDRGFDVTIRYGSGKSGPVKSDVGGLIVDVKPPKEYLDKLRELDLLLNSIPGVISTGLFINLADKIYVISSSGYRVLK